MRLVPSKIGSQAMLLSFVPLAFLVVFLALVAILVNRTQELTLWTQRAEQVLDRSDQIFKTLGDANRAVVDYATLHRKSALDAYRNAARSLQLQTRDLVEIVNDPSQKRRASQFARQTNAIVSILSRYLAEMRSGQAAKARALAAAPSTRALAANFQTTKATFDRVERQLTGARFRDLRSQLRVFSLILLVFTVVGILLTLLTTGRFGVRIASRLEQLARNAERLGSGRPAVPVAGTDEIADLDRAYHQMAQRIHDTLLAYQREHYVASTLQRALLPQELPRVPGIRVDTAYVTAAHAGDIGGDWYDLFTLDDHVVGISVGDVAGHGLRAATVMGAVRQSIRTAARVDSEPWSVLNRANRVLCADEQDVVVTAFFAVLDLRDGSMRYSVAGHPLPLLVHPGKEIEQLPGEGLILGVDPQARFHAYEANLQVSDALVCFTDGIVEIERNYFKGMDDLISAVKTEYAKASSENIAEAIKDRILAHAQPLDDSAILFIGITNLGQARSIREQTWTIDAKEQGAARRVRRAVLWDLAKSVSPASDLLAVELIVGELLSNVVRHTPGPAEITLERRDGAARLRVRDRGKPFRTDGVAATDPLTLTGRGLFLVRKLARDVEFESTDKGNCVSVLLPVDVSEAA